MDDPTSAIIITALATATSAVVAIAALLEARAVRIATRDAAMVVARLRFSDDRQDYAELHLENLGPGLARDVHLRISYADAAGVTVAAADPVVVAMLVPGVADRQAFLPALLLQADDTVPVPDLDELADRGLSLRLELDWLDERRWLPAPWVHRRQRSDTRVDHTAYRSSNLRALRIADPTILSEIQATRAMLERRWFESDAHASLARRELPPDIAVQAEARRVQRSLDLWRARFRWWIGRVRGR